MLDTKAIRGSWATIPLIVAPNCAIIGSINAEWNACETANRCARQPWPVSRSATTAVAASGPEITTESGPLTAAILTPSSSIGATCAALAVTATITPPGGSCAINRPRADTSRAASVSDSTPAT